MTFFEASGQAAVFLMLLYAGAAAGVTYDLIAPLRRRVPGTLGAVLDGLWCLWTAALCFLALALGGEGAFRLYALLGLCCGAGIYTLGVRQLAKGLWALGQKMRLFRWGGRKTLSPRRISSLREKEGS